MYTENNQADVRSNTALSENLDCCYPVIQAAMGWVCDANLVVASTCAGDFSYLASDTVDSKAVEAKEIKVIGQIIMTLQRWLK